MINSGYFTSRHEILDWLNSLLAVELTKIEQLGSGSLYCQVLDAAYPHKVPLHKLKWNAFLEVDFLHNFKILQTAFERLGIGRTIQTQKLVKAKYQDNLEFIQWMKWHLGPLIANHPHYDALARRANAQPYLLFTERRGKDDKENMVRSVGVHTALKSYRSVQQLKPEKTLTKGESMRTLRLSENKGIGSNPAKRVALQQKNVANIPVVESDEEECF